MAAPNVSTGQGARVFMPLQTIKISATYQINSGSAIAAGASVTDSVTFTGVQTTDTQVAVGFGDAVAADIAAAGLKLTSVTVTATNTVALTWQNQGTLSSTPPATSQDFYAVRLALFYGK